jgi:hypothetical protein
MRSRHSRRPRVHSVLQALRVLRVAAIMTASLASVAAAQVQATTRTGVQVRADSLNPPISPRQAFFYSLAIPGLGQAKLDRPMVGAGFFLVEVLSIALVHRTADDLRLARAFQGDSVPVRYAVDPVTGVVQRDSKMQPVVAEWAPAYYSAELVRARRLQLEDWSAVLLFNHLLAGAEAFVAAQLWDLPQHVKLRASARAGGGFAIGAQIRVP